MRSGRCVGLVLAVALVGACSSATGVDPSAAANPPRPADCAPPPAADLGSSEGWVGHIAAAPDDVAFVVDDGRGTVVSHGADTPMPLASASKVVHLAAYGRAVAEGRIAPDEPVAVADWQRWYLPTDGGAHEAALARLRPGPTVTVDEMVSSMIQESDNATADWLRDRLGDDALTEAAADGGWAPLDTPSFLGAALALVLPDQAPPSGAPRADRAAAEHALAERYAADPAFREQALGVLTARVTDDAEGFLAEQAQWADGTASGTAAQVTALYRALATGEFGAGSDVAARHLQWQGDVVGFKSGVYSTVLTLGSWLRRDDGTVGYATILARRLPTPPGPGTVVAQQQLVLGALDDDGLRTRLLCVA